MNATEIPAAPGICDKCMADFRRWHRDVEAHDHPAVAYCRHTESAAAYYPRERQWRACSAAYTEVVA